MKRNWKKLAIAGAVVAVGFGLVVEGASSAQAASIGTTIVCTVTFDNLHGSTHVGGTANGTISTHCTQPVDVIRSYVTLKNLTNGKTNNLGGVTTYGSKDNIGNSALACTPGTYQVSGEVDVTFGPGVKPPATSIEGASKALTLPCNNIDIVGPASAQALVPSPATAPQTFTFNISRR